jgi:hypothetical protein
MTDEEVEALLDNLERWDTRRAKQSFLHRMERKMLGRKDNS